MFHLKIKIYSVMKVFKIRCSAIGHIMTESKSAITEKQLIEITELTTKNRTEKQTERLNELIYKRDNPELSATAKTYCENWLQSIIYERKLEFTNKYIEKGLIMEDASIDFVSEQLGIGFLFKDDKYLEDDFMTGSMDIDLPDFVYDIKNSWSWETFPLFETDIPNKDYYWQLQGYMKLTNKNNAKLIYCLSDTPKHIIEREARNYCFYNGYGELDMEIYNDFYKKLTYQDVDPKLKMKIFDIERNNNDIEKINQRVIECRTYIETLKKLLPC
jgi:hypothetical protein